MEQREDKCLAFVTPGEQDPGDAGAHRGDRCQISLHSLGGTLPCPALRCLASVCLQGQL